MFLSIRILFLLNLLNVIYIFCHMSDSAGIIGSLLSGIISSASQLYTNRQNRKLNETRWQQSVELANTAHQREVSDLRAAGLNPILSAGGSGSSVPSLGAAEMLSPGQGISDGISSAAKFASKEYNANVDNTKAQTDLYNHQQDLVNSQHTAQQISNDFKQYQLSSQMPAFTVDKIRNGAELEALTGKRYDFVNDIIDWGDRKAREAYTDLVQGFRNRIGSDRYLNSTTNKVFNDIKGFVPTGSYKLNKGNKK